MTALLGLSLRERMIADTALYFPAGLWHSLWQWRSRGWGEWGLGVSSPSSLPGGQLLVGCGPLSKTRPLCGEWSFAVTFLWALVTIPSSCLSRPHSVITSLLSLAPVHSFLSRFPTHIFVECPFIKLFSASTQSVSSAWTVTLPETSPQNTYPRPTPRGQGALFHSWYGWGEIYFLPLVFHSSFSSREDFIFLVPLKFVPTESI